MRSYRSLKLLVFKLNAFTILQGGGFEDFIKCRE